jgi:DNA repair protein RadD
LKLAGASKRSCFASSIAHSQHIVEQFRASGVTAEHLDCYMDDDTRADISGRFERGDFTVLSNVSLLSEGFDVPDTACMILASPRRASRGSCRWWAACCALPGKTHALLLDHSGSVERIGHPFDDLPLELCDGTRTRPAAGRRSARSRAEALPECKFVKPAGVHECPKCGFKPERQSDMWRCATASWCAGPQDQEARDARPQAARLFAVAPGVPRNKGYSPGWVCAQVPRDVRRVAARHA